jgi:protein O-GlcNAc transferase
MALGRLDDALASYDRSLAIDPRVVLAWNSRANVLHGMKRFEEALASYDRALGLKPDLADAHNNRGTVLRSLDLPTEALASYEAALALKPDFAEAHNNRGNVLVDLKRPGEALASYDRTLAIDPQFVPAWNGKATALQGLRRFEEALASYDKALGLSPDFVDAHINRGNVLVGLKRPEEALASYDRALALRPDDAGALSNRATALQNLKRFEEALASYDRALALRPDLARTYNNRANVLKSLGRFEDALASYDKAVASDPMLAEALRGRGNLCLDLHRHEDAVADFEHALGIDPDFDYARGHLHHVRMSCSDWSAFASETARIVAGVRGGKRPSVALVLLGVSGACSDQLLCAQAWIRDKWPALSPPLWNGERWRHDRIRVAYLSADFRDHAVSYLLAGLFEQHDRRRFEVTALSYGSDSPGETGRRIKGAFDRFIDIRARDDRDVANLLREHQVDIAVDLMGHTRDSRSGIFAFRPAPIAVNYLGYPGSMGADYIDYIIADRFVIPDTQRQHYSENVVYLPDTFQGNDSERRIGEGVLTRAEAGLPETGFVFCSFNNTYKITPAVFDIWMRLLRDAEGSVLWLLADQTVIERNLRREAEARGISPSRLVFAPRVDYADHLARYRLADLFLDTLPFNAGATASDALWAGLPVVTCAGEAFAGRMAGSLLHAAGLPELVTHSLEDYEALALRLARDSEVHAGFRVRLAMNRTTCPLFDTDRFRRHIEAAYTTMWERWQRGEPPQDFGVAS